MSEVLGDVQVWGRYTVLRKIGSGGMADVFLARSRGALGIEKLLVVKRINPTLGKSAKFIDMFVDEARVAMGLNHSNIVQVYAFEKIEGAHLLAMEHVDGWDLMQVMVETHRKQVPIPVGLAAFIAAESAKGLDYAHSRRDEASQHLGIVHRDVSPQNILVSTDGAVKVTDFGIARVRWLHEEQVGEVKGKIGYMSPQQARGLPVDHRADIFSLGVVLYEMLTGRRLIAPRGGEESLLETMRQADFPSPRDLDKDIPLALDGVVRRAMAFDPDDRYPTARAMAHELLVYMHGLDQIVDSQALQEWLADNIPRDEADDNSAADSELHTRDATTIENLGKTASLRVLGDMEKRVAVLVSAQVTIAPHPRRAAVSAELSRLSSEMAYKADGVMDRVPGGVRIFLGLDHSTLEDSIRGIRLARNLGDLARVLAGDHGLEIQFRCSVNRGYVNCGKDRSAARISFEPEPQLVDTAGVLLHAAEDDQILVGGGVYRLAKGDFKFDTPVSVWEAVDGEQILGYRLLGALPRSERGLDELSTPFAGREADLAVLANAYGRARTGMPTLVRIEGEKGIGKSRLVRHFLEQESARSRASVLAECLFAERDTGLAAAAAVVRQILKLSEDVAREDVFASLEKALSDAPTYLSRQVSMFHLLLGDPETFLTGAGKRQREAIRRVSLGLGVLLKRLFTDECGIIVVENAQWMDGPSQDVLSELATLGGRVPLLILLVGDGALAGRRIKGLETMALKELGASEMRQVMDSRLGKGQEIAEITEQILARAQGNPFFASEIVDSLIERGILAPLEPGAREGTGPRYRQTSSGAIRLPTTMEGLAAGHIDALPPELRTVLRAASAVGASFSVDTLSRLVGRDVSGEVMCLVTDEFFIPASKLSNGVPAFRFKKPMVREAAHGGLTTGDRERIHRLMAEDLKNRAARGERIPASRIAWHLDHSGEDTEAGEYYLKGADDAMEAYSSRRAMRLYDRALSLLPRGSAIRFAALERREKVLRELGLKDERAGAIGELEDLAGHLEDTPMKALAACRRAQFQYDMGEYDGAAGTIKRALDLAVRASDVRGQLEGMHILAYVAGQVGHLDRAVECCDTALQMLPSGPEGAFYEATFLGTRGALLLDMGRLNAASDYLARALVYFRRLGHRHSESRVTSNLAMLAGARGDMSEGIDFLERAILIDRGNRDVSARGRKLVAVGSLRLELGELVSALEYLEEGRRVCHENSEPLGEVEADLGLAEYWMHKGDLRGAEEILVAVDRRSFVSRSRLLQVRHLLLRSQVARSRGDFETALHHGDEATRIARGAGMEGEVVHGALHRGMALLGLGRGEEALAATDLVDDRLAQLGGVRRAEMVWWMRYLVMAAANETAGAAGALQAARREVARRHALIRRPKFKSAYLEHPLIQQINGNGDMKP